MSLWKNIELKPGTFKNIIRFNFDEKTYIYLFRSGIDIQELANNLKPYIKGRIGYLVYRQYKVISKYINQHLTDFQNLTKYRFTIKYNLKDLKKFPVVMQDITYVTEKLTRYSAINPFWLRALNYTDPYNSSRKSILLFAYKLDQPVNLTFYSTVYNLYIRALRKQTLPDFIFLYLISKKAKKWLIIKTDSIDAKSAAKYIRILFRFIKKLEKVSVTKGSSIDDNDLENLLSSTHEEVKDEEEDESKLKIDYKEKEKKTIKLAGEKVKVNANVITRPDKENNDLTIEQPENKILKNTAKLLLKKEDKDKIVKNVLISKDSNEIKQRLFSIIEDKAIKKLTDTPNNISFDKHLQWKSFKSFHCPITDYEYNKTLNYFKETKDLLPALKEGINDYTVNGTINLPRNHNKLSFNVSDKIFFNLIKNLLDSNNLEIVEFEVKDDIYRSDDTNLKITKGKNIFIKFKDPSNESIHTAEFFFPYVDEYGRVFINNNYYSLVNQLYPKPVQSYKPGIVRVHSLDGVLTFERRKQTTMLKIMGSRITPPLLYILNTPDGFNKLMDKYNIKYKIVDKNDIEKNKLAIRISKDKYLVILNENLDTKQKFLLDNIFSAIKINKLYETYEKTKQEPLSNEWFENVINIITDNPNATFYIKQKSSIFLDAITKEFLIQEGYPDNLNDLVLYINDLLAENPNFTLSKNLTDLNRFRLRTYEQIEHLAFKMLADEVLLYKRNKDIYKTIKTIKIQKSEFLTKLLSGFTGERLIENANPLEEIATLNKIEYRGFEGLKEEAASVEHRGLDPSYKNTIDPYDTPEGKNIGLTNVAANGFNVLTLQGKIIQPDIKQAKGRMFGPVVSLIPFSARNESARLLMSANQFKQALPIKDLEKPAILTGYEPIIAVISTDTHVIKAPCNGTVIDIKENEKLNTKTIVLECEDGDKKEITFNSFEMGRSGAGKHAYLEKHINVNIKDEVKEGEIIASTNWIKDNVYQYGTNVLAAFVNFHGNTYEDGIVVSEDLIDRLTSTHLQVNKAYLEPEDKLIYFGIKEIGQKIEPGDIILSVDSKNFSVFLDDEIFEDTEIVGTESGYKIIATVKGYVKYVKIFVTPRFESTLFTTNTLDAEKFIIRKDDEAVIYLKNKPLQGMFIEIGIIYDSPLDIGDKLVTRHANKGVISQILPKNKMPLVKSLNERCDILFSGQAIVDRAINGVVYEMYSTKISRKLAEYYLSIKTDKDFETLDEVFNNLKMFGDNNYEMYKRSSYDPSVKKQLIDFIKETGFYPILVEPFTNLSPKQLIKFLHYLEIPVKEDLYLPTIKETVKAVAGYLYLMKLEHMSYAKLSARSVGPYDPKTGQPRYGKGGGQKLGEMDFMQLIAWDVPDIMHEILVENANVRKLIYRNIIENGKVSMQEINSYMKDLKAKEVSSNYLDVLTKSILLKLF